MINWFAQLVYKVHTHTFMSFVDFLFLFHHKALRVNLTNRWSEVTLTTHAKHTMGWFWLIDLFIIRICIGINCIVYDNNNSGIYAYQCCGNINDLFIASPTHCIMII